MRTYANLFYFREINSIGGVESWYYYISKLYSDYDIAILYVVGDPIQIARLSKYVTCIKWDEKTRFKCKKLFVNFNHEIIDYVDSESVHFFIHGDYKDMINRGQLGYDWIEKWKNDKRITEYLAISKLVQRTFYELSGIMPTLCYNPVVLEEPCKFIRLCSAQRMTKEKGGERIRRLIKELDRYCSEHDATYEYTIYTNDSHIFKQGDLINNDKLIIKKPILDANKLFGYYDYFVALSDNEGFCYSVVEALMRNTPCIVTPCPVFKEIGVNDENSFELNFDCSNISEVVEKMFTNKLSFNYNPPKTAFSEILSKEDPTREVNIQSDNNIDIQDQVDRNNQVLVKCIRKYYDLNLNRYISRRDEPFYVDTDRADYLCSVGAVKKYEE